MIYFAISKICESDQ